MATTTSNFSWPIPQSTDLVKDGATAIASLGSGIDTSMADLKGGTTGQILSKTSNTDMDFTWITPNPGDITGVTAGTGITGGGTSGDVTVSFDVANYGGGQKAAGKNAVINGGFDIWQRGTSATFSGSAATYVGADRWYNYAGSTCTVSRQTADTTNLTYALRFGRNSGQTNTSVVYTGQVFESINSKPFADQTVTLSFYAKKGADAPTTLNAQLYTGTGTDQTATQLFSGWTGGAVVFDNAFTVSTTMTRYSYTGTIASTANQIAVSFKYTPSGTAGANEWFQIEGVQLELGSSATPFSRAGGSIDGELSLCQRYYIRTTSGTSEEPVALAGYAYSTTVCSIPYVSKSSMRTAPNAVDFSNLQVSDNNGAAQNVTNVTISKATSDCINLSATVASGLTANKMYWLTGKNSLVGYVGLSAEL